MISFMGTTNYWDMAADIRINTVNCVGISGKGIALEFKQRYPLMFMLYRDLCRQGKFKPGNIYISHWGNGPQAVEIWNATTKDHWKNPSSYEWVNAIIQQIQLTLVTMPPRTISIPALGCGNGGLCWNAVAEKMCKVLSNMPHTIQIFNPIGGVAFDMKIP